MKVCPNCGREYDPEYDTWEEAPEGSIGREQHQTGVCSEECWIDFVGAPL